MPDPANSLSARAGFIVTDSFCPGASSSDASASDIDGCSRASVERAHGMSMLFGLAMLMVPTAPADWCIFQRSPADPKCACSGPGSDRGVDAMYTAMASLRLTPAKSLMPRSGMFSP